MLQAIDNLDEFIKYCNLLIEEDSFEEEDNVSWFLHVVALDASKEEIIKDIKTNLNIYYKWLGQAQLLEDYVKCGTIYQAIEIENTHYESLGNHILKKSIKKEMKEINERLKNKYL